MVRNEVLDLHLYVWNDNYISLSKQNELQKNKTNSPDIFKQFFACFDTSNMQLLCLQYKWFEWARNF